ncbi:MAG: hypothetical protein C4520_00905 [Candidatus Abyssobacteria bacterium SURF_5]|uniref:CBM20 domain-containing protein n=1 Tax=Abyssobacteria bacterium (strain SURF_5) TaxID=2093360 RepID=A0A3A4P5X3_ABYX5|nr:MAG: hypothetical protein C4520_00905 [Candidatus Abyssubacteria bacterium SURF_5]
MKTKLALLRLLLLISLSLTGCVIWDAHPALAMYPGATDIMLQGFHWQAKNNGQHGAWYDLIAARAQDMQEAGITIVWFPPASKTPRWDLNEEGDPYSACGYVPMDYYDLGEYEQWVQDGWPNYTGRWYRHGGFETLYGSREELEDAINVLHGRGIRAIADIVLNHRGPRQKNDCDEWISWGDETGTIASGKMFWGHKNDCSPPEVVSSNGGGGGNDDGESEFPPNIAHQDANVRSQFKGWLFWMRNSIGFDGWRYDYVKGFSPDRVREYNDATNPTWSVGEFWDENTDAVIAWINASHTDDAKKSAAFDFSAKSILTRSFGAGNYEELKALPGLMGRWPAKAVTFLDNHDTHPPHENPRQFPDHRLLEGYAYVLTHPGVPCIYWQHFYDKGQLIHDKIKELSNLRREQGISNTSTVWVIRAEQDLYAAQIDNKLVVKIGSQPWEPADAGISGYTVRSEYGDYRIWTKTSTGGAETVFRVHRDVGFGNFVSIRGSIPQLNNWGGPGRSCVWSPGNIWQCVVTDIPAGQSFEWKSLKNDSIWESGPNHSGAGQTTHEIRPSGY